MTDKLKAMLPDLILGLVTAVLVITLNWAQEYPLFHLLCDGAFVAAVLLLGTGGIRFCRNQGALDMLGYGASSLLNMFLHAGQRERREEDYYTYCQRKAEERKPVGNALQAGCVYLILAVVFYLLYLLMPGI